ncbi:MAG TPA: aldo/keto reductase [Steroidobacteraceae bacterium]|jgi:aryl-alcohol dehydrogenase-like predicted oxidoreductase|nr:aldo/keto reductase [Steroidobacteraceae bacterium]
MKILTGPPPAGGSVLSRREAAMLTLAAGVGALWTPHAFAAGSSALITKPIPSTGERLPVIGLGTNAFSEAKLDELRALLKRMVELGGSVIDTAPAYGESEQVIGQLVAALGIRERIFLASKLTAGPQVPGPAAPATQGIFAGGYGGRDLERSLERLKTDHLDLLQVHNMQGVEQLWPQLIEWKQAKKIRYIGMTTSVASDHPRMIELMRKFPVDFVQVDYSIANRDAAMSVFPVALERKIAVIANVPFGGRSGANLTQSQNRPLPPFAAEFGASDWPQLLLKYVVSHPAVTCTIAGSTKVEHLEDNQAAARGALPDAAGRRRIEQSWDAQA